MRKLTNLFGRLRHALASRSARPAAGGRLNVEMLESRLCLSGVSAPWRVEATQDVLEARVELDGIRIRNIESALALDVVYNKTPAFNRNLDELSLELTKVLNDLAAVNHVTLASNLSHPAVNRTALIFTDLKTRATTNGIPDYLTEQQTVNAGRIVLAVDLTSHSPTQLENTENGLPALAQALLALDYDVFHRNKSALPGDIAAFKPAYLQVINDLAGIPNRGGPSD